MKPKLRVGLLLDALTVPAWTYAMLERVVRSECADVVCVVMNAGGAAVAGSGGARDGGPAWRRGLSVLLARALRHAIAIGLMPSLIWTAERVVRDTAMLNRYLQWLVRDVLDGEPPPTPDAFRPVDAAPLLGQAAVLTVQPEQTQFSDRLAGPDVDRIKGYRLDVLIRLGFRILRGDILNAAPCGVWSYHHGDNAVYRGSAPGFWEVVEQDATAGVVLQVLCEDLDGGAVLARAVSATVPFSVKRTRNSVYWRGVDLVPRALEELFRDGSERFLERIRADEARPCFYSRPMRTDPPRAGLAAPVRNLVRAMRRTAQWTKRHRYQWTLLYALRQGGPETALWRYKQIVPPPDRYWADPFAVRVNDRYVVFIEEFLYATGKGHIAALEIAADGTWSRPRPVLQRPYHLSYPFLFECDGVRYMIPETRRNRTIELYRCREFPGVWEQCATLMDDVEAVDTTLWQHQGKWWMFTGMTGHAGASASDALCLFVSDHPVRGTWQPHPKNPIVSDVRRARPAGGLFVRNHTLYRPAQDCSVRYGYGIRVHEVETLSETDYTEREVGFIEPKWAPGLHGVHHIGFVDGLSVADVQIGRRMPKRRSSPSAPR
jgi:hypothetical protein